MAPGLGASETEFGSKTHAAAAAHDHDAAAEEDKAAHAHERPDDAAEDAAADAAENEIEQTVDSPGGGDDEPSIDFVLDATERDPEEAKGGDAPPAKHKESGTATKAKGFLQNMKESVKTCADGYEARMLEMKVRAGQLLEPSPVLSALQHFVLELWG